MSAEVKKRSDREQLLQETRRLLDDIPFGVYDGKVLTLRSSREADLVRWIERAYALRFDLAAAGVAP